MNGHEVALWAGVAAGFGSMLAVGLVDLADIQGWAEFLGSLLVAGFTAGAVYAHERLTLAKDERMERLPK